MRKILITASEKIINQIEKKLRHEFEIDFEYSDSSEGKIEAKKDNKWITICRFSCDENLDNIITMFNVNYEIKCR
jgi:hypothetical protein